MKIWMSPSLIRVLGILIILTLVKNFLRVVKNYCMKCIMSMEQIWGAIRESTMLICDNPVHNYHTVPDYYAEQNLRSVEDDCEMLIKKVFHQISEYIDLPDFYYEEQMQEE